MLSWIFADDFRERNAVSEQLIRIEIDLVLLHEAADGRDLGNAFYRLEGITQIPILERAQLGQIVFPGLIDERVFEDPADAGGVGPNHRD